MDNLTHSLVGLALAGAGLKRTTRFGTATLVVGANLPDLDALMYLAGDNTDALAFRRGWTHGVLAMVLLPLLLTALMLGLGRLARRGPAEAQAPPVDARGLLLLAAVSIWSHPLLDLLNTYGVRLLMPFSGRWFYGDALFIVDPWVWAVLALGVLASRRRGARGTWPPRLALAVTLAYAMSMAVSSRIGRGLVDRQSRVPGRRTMVAPVPGTPFRREVIRDLGGAYEIGTLALPGSAYEVVSVDSTGSDATGVRAASATREGRQFLGWSRFPIFVSRRRGDSIRVIMSDARYANPGGGSWASVTVTVPAER